MRHEAREMAVLEMSLTLTLTISTVDYAEMVTQFGYVALWSLVWPLAPLFAFVNNYIELRSDAVK